MQPGANLTPTEARDFEEATLTQFAYDLYAMRGELIVMPEAVKFLRLLDIAVLLSPE